MIEVVDPVVALGGLGSFGVGVVMVIVVWGWGGVWWHGHVQGWVGKLTDGRTHLHVGEHRGVVVGVHEVLVVERRDGVHDALLVAWGGEKGGVPLMLVVK